METKVFLKNASFVVLGFGATRYLTPKKLSLLTSERICSTD